VGGTHICERGFHIQWQLEESPRLLEVLLDELRRHSGVPDVEEAVLPARHQQKGQQACDVMTTSSAKTMTPVKRRVHLHANCSSGVISSALASMSITGTYGRHQDASDASLSQLPAHDLSCAGFSRVDQHEQRSIVTSDPRAGEGTHQWSCTASACPSLWFRRFRAAGGLRT